jgi:hypothetical protein
VRLGMSANGWQIGSSIGRAALTAALLIFALPPLLRGFDGPFGAGARISFWAIAIPVIALACAAPTFRIAQYVANGLVALVAFPIVYAMLNPPGPGSEFTLPMAMVVGAVWVSGPALLGLSGSSLIWVAIRYLRRRGYQAVAVRVPGVPTGTLTGDAVAVEIQAAAGYRQLDLEVWYPGERESRLVARIDVPSERFDWAWVLPPDTAPGVATVRVSAVTTSGNVDARHEAKFVVMG